MLNNRDHSRLTYFTASLASHPSNWKNFFAVIEGTHSMTKRFPPSEMTTDFKFVISELKKEFESHDKDLQEAKNSRIEIKYILAEIVDNLLKKSTCKADPFSEAGHSLKWWVNEYYTRGGSPKI